MRARPNYPTFNSRDMPTVRAIKAFKEITENNRPASVAMREVGYSPSSATKPSQLTKSKGFKELMAASGLTEALIANALVEDIKAKPKRRVRELDLGARILKMTAERAPDAFAPTVIRIGTLNVDARQHVNGTEPIYIKTDSPGVGFPSPHSTTDTETDTLPRSGSHTSGEQHGSHPVIQSTDELPPLS